MTSKKITSAMSILFLISSAVIFYSFDRSKADWIIIFWGVIGSNASVLGIIYTIIQLNKLRDESEIIIRTANDTKNKINELNGFGDIAKAIKLIQEIQGYARSRKHEVGLMRLQELKITITQIKSLNTNASSLPDLSQTIISINQLINGMEKEISVKSNTLKSVLVNTVLEKISDLLVEIQTNALRRN